MSGDNGAITTKIINTRDNKLNYIVGEIPEDNKSVKWVGDKVDYGIDFPKLEPEPENNAITDFKNGLPDTRKNLSFLQVKSIEEGIEWYRNLDPKIPEELLPLFARWNWGDLSTLTKKQVKNEHKKAVKKGKKKGEINSIKINRQPFVVEF